MAASKEPAEPIPMDFADVIRDLGKGTANSQLSRMLTEVVQACRATGGKGKLVLTIAVGADDNMAELAITPKATLPHPKIPGGSFFTTKTGGLVTEDPRQLTLGAKVLSMPGIKTRPPDDGGNLS